MYIRSEKTRSWVSNIVSIDVRWLMTQHCLESTLKFFVMIFETYASYATSKIKVC